MTAPVRITKAEFEAVISAAKDAGAARVVFDHGRIVVELKEDLDGEQKGGKSRPEDDWSDAA